MPVALITGIGGQDGSYLSEFLLNKGYRVLGTVPDSDPVNTDRIRHLLDRIKIVQDDLLDQDRIEKIVLDSRPDEMYNFAANSVLAASFQQPILATMVLAMGVTRILEAIRKVAPKARFFQASSSEIFGKPAEVPQSETTPFHPRNPYGVSKVYGHLMTMTYRENYGLYACSGILYNHESPRRSPEFVTRKITLAAAKIKLGLAKELASRKPGCAPRLGVRGRLRARHVAHAAAAAARRLCARHRGNPLRAGTVRGGVLAP